LREIEFIKNRLAKRKIHIPLRLLKNAIIIPSTCGELDENNLP